jgi:hypothetical protein
MVVSNPSSVSKTGVGTPGRYVPTRRVSESILVIGRRFHRETGNAIPSSSLANPPEKVLTVSCHPDYSSKEAVRRKCRTAFSFPGKGLRRQQYGSNKPNSGSPAGPRCLNRAGLRPPFASSRRGLQPTLRERGPLCPFGLTSRPRSPPRPSVRSSWPCRRPRRPCPTDTRSGGGPAGDKDEGTASTVRPRRERVRAGRRIDRTREEDGGQTDDEEALQGQRCPARPGELRRPR